jgi:hypothetical protein
MGLLGDIYSTADTAKRRLKGLLADPLGTLALGIERFGEDQKGLLNLRDNAYPMAGNNTVLNTPEQISGFRDKLATEMTNQAMAGATVWHGSPHKFSKFDASKIGTGEGAQAYGHGLYLAESPAVAGSYADKLGERIYKGKAVKSYDYLGNVDFVDGSKAIIPDGEWAAFRSAVDKPASPGQMYKVDLPDEHIAKMLDWDKPLSQQHPDVQATLKQSLGASYKDSMYGEDAYRRLQKIQQNQAPIISKPDGAYRNDSAVPGMTSEALRNAGIPGIRYLDGGSRGTGTGTSNFVIFPGNEGLLQILERNGAPIK